MALLEVDGLLLDLDVLALPVLRHHLSRVPAHHREQELNWGPGQCTGTGTGTQGREVEQERGPRTGNWGPRTGNWVPGQGTGTRTGSKDREQGPELGPRTWSRKRLQDKEQELGLGIGAGMIT